LARGFPQRRSRGFDPYGKGARRHRRISRVAGHYDATLTGPDCAGLDRTDILENVYQNSDVVIYKIKTEPNA
jgi:hypothetical protein